MSLRAIVESTVHIEHFRNIGTTRDTSHQLILLTTYFIFQKLGKKGLNLYYNSQISLLGYKRKL